MARVNPTPRLLKVIDLRVPPWNPAAPQVADQAPVSQTDRTDHDLVTVRSSELRTGLASMVGCAQLIDSGDLTDDQSHMYAKMLQREGRRLSALVSNAEALQRLENGHGALDLAPVDLRSLIGRAVMAAGEDDLRPIELHVREHLPLVSAEAEAILKVLANFLTNARRFSPDGGAIRVAARRVGDEVEVSIRDRGVGIEAAALSRVFHKGYRADGVRKLGPGAGLGLALNHKIIEAHGGRVEASSKGPGKGACFKFTLPLSRAEAWSGDVLIVEDDAGFASLMKAEFAAQGISTVRAADAETAELMLIDLTPRAIILDLALPGMQGEDFLGRMHARRGVHPPVVVLTVKYLGVDEIAALEVAGAVAVLPKEAGAPQAAVALIAEALAFDPVGR